MDAHAQKAKFWDAHPHNLLDFSMLAGTYPKGFMPPMPCIVHQRDIFLTDIIGYDRLKLYLQIIPPKCNTGYITVC